jgi:UDP-4-amino-4-deoxy-L-arabinose formyltransferase/UDP-glucuronic acid dehydrogenase (UDP-4-keto-hexauronic acid decarboxylating)
LVIRCGEGAVEVVTGQGNGGVTQSGVQLAEEAGTGRRHAFRWPTGNGNTKSAQKSVLILGVNGFIGNHLSERLLDSGRYEVHGMDLAGSLDRFMDHPDFHFFRGDISIHREWIEYHVRKCDIVLPLVAIATPIEYVRTPCGSSNWTSKRTCAWCATVPSTANGSSSPPPPRCTACAGTKFRRRPVAAGAGPHPQAALDLLVQQAAAGPGDLGLRRHPFLPFTLFRPFNWIGPRLDSLESARIGSSRAITQLILNLAEGTPIKLVDGGQQKRCFTDVKDGVECLFRIIENRGNAATAGFSISATRTMKPPSSPWPACSSNSSKTIPCGIISAPGRYPQGGEPGLLRLGLRGCPAPQAQHRKCPADPEMEPGRSPWCSPWKKPWISFSEAVRLMDSGNLTGRGKPFPPFRVKVGQLP